MTMEVAQERIQYLLVFQILNCFEHMVRSIPNFRRQKKVSATHMLTIRQVGRLWLLFIEVRMSS